MISPYKYSTFLLDFFFFLDFLCKQALHFNIRYFLNWKAVISGKLMFMLEIGFSKLRNLTEVYSTDYDI